MKKLSAYLFLFLFSFQTSSWTDDIRDFEIEGISVGDSLLDYFTKENIEIEKKSEYVFIYKDNKFMDIGVGPDPQQWSLVKEFDLYEDATVTIKPNDKSYEIYSITGRIFCNSIKVCKSKQKEITSELKILFGNQARFETYKDPHPLDETGNSFVYGNRFVFESTKDEIAADIYQWSEKMKSEKNYRDNIKVDISKAEFVNFLMYEAYK